MITSLIHFIYNSVLITSLHLFVQVSCCCSQIYRILLNCTPVSIQFSLPWAFHHLKKQQCILPSFFVMHYSTSSYKELSKLVVLSVFHTRDLSTEIHIAPTSKAKACYSVVFLSLCNNNCCY